MSRWGHGHSMAAGIAGGLLLAGHTIELLGAALLVGVFIGRVWRAAAAAGELLAERLHTSPQEPPAARRSSRKPRGRGFTWTDFDGRDGAFYGAARRQAQRAAGALARFAGYGDDDGIPF